MAITRRQIDVYKELVDMILKAIIALVLLVCFCIVLYFLLTSEPNWEKTAPLGIVEALMAGSFYKLMPHFFPDRKNE